MHSVFIQTLMNFHWGSCAQPTTWQAERVGRWRREQQIDRWHFTSAGGSTESRVSPKSSWGGTSFRLQGPPHKPPPPFRWNKWAKPGDGFREHLRHILFIFIQNFGNCISHCKEKSHLFFSLNHQLANWQCIALFYVHLCIFLFLSVPSFLFELWVCLLYN